MNRLGIVVLYDSEGIAYDYFLYYLEKLKAVCNKLILVVNGIITDDSKEKCRMLVDDIYVRQNRNWDIGAYLEAIYNWVTVEECLKYDEIVLSNDTIFGPFTSFSDIFNEMSKKNYDVWGLNVNPLLYSEHIQSFFYCFRNGSIKEALKYWSSINLPKHFTKRMYIGAYECGISNYLTQRGMKLGAYATYNNFNVYNTPQILLKYCNFPFLKKSINSSTVKRNILECNYLECIDYIEKISAYPVEYITDYLKIKYALDIDNMRKSLGVENVDSKKLRYNQFVDKFQEIYLYGTGQYGQMFYGMLGENRVKGFVVSSHVHENEMYNKKVYCIDEIDKDSPILVTMSESNTKEVALNLSKYEHVCYIW